MQTVPPFSIVNSFRLPIFVTVKYLPSAFADDILNHTPSIGYPIFQIWNDLYLSEYFVLYFIVVTSGFLGNVRIVSWSYFFVILMYPCSPKLGILVDFFLPYAQVLSLFSSWPSSVSLHCWARKR